MRVVFFASSRYAHCYKRHIEKETYKIWQKYECYILWEQCGQIISIKAWFFLQIHGLHATKTC